MAAQMRQVLRQSQSAVMTQKLQQAIKLLQLTSIELTGVIENEVERNPFLDFEEPTGDEPQPVTLKQKAEGDQATNRLDHRFANLFDQEGVRSGGVAAPQSRWRDSSGGADGGDPAEARVAAGITLYDHLMAQVPLTFDEAGDLAIAAELVGSEVAEVGQPEASNDTINPCLVAVTSAP